VAKPLLERLDYLTLPDQSGNYEACAGLCRDAAAEIRVLRSALYKIQSPVNQNKFPGEYLDDNEKAAVRRAVTERL
jgi:hypothetical protein